MNYILIPCYLIPHCIFVWLTIFSFLVLKNLAQIKRCHFYEAGTFTVLFQKTIPGQEGSYHGFDVICLPSIPARGLFLGVVTSRSAPSSPVA